MKKVAIHYPNWGYNVTNITFSLIFSGTDNCMLRIFFIFGTADGVLQKTEQNLCKIPVTLTFLK